MIHKDIPVVILAGGFGTRLRDQTEFILLYPSQWYQLGQGRFYGIL